MANEPQGLITFPGVQGYLTGSFTLGHGITPSICRFQCVPQASPPPESGTLSVSFGGQRLQFPDCRILDIEVIADSSGRKAWAISLADCRWRWKNYRVSGQYNLRLNDQNLDLASKKNSQELAKILLEAMDLKDADYSQVPKDLFPYVDWDYARADQELQKLLDSVGCRIALGLNNQVRIVRLGVGRDLPQSNVVDGQATFEVTEWPDQLKFVAGPTMIQVDVPLEYVGLEPSGAVKALKDLSYRPGFPFSTENPFERIEPGSMAGVEGASVEAAKKSVYKWFRPKMPLELFGDVLPKGKDNKADEVKDLWQILPLLTTQIPHVDLEKKEKYTPDAIVWGYTDPMNLVPPLVPPAKKPLAKEVVKKKTPIIFKDFEIDQENGIIKFEDPQVTRFFDSENGVFVNVLSELYLRVAVQVRELETRSKVHHEVIQNVTPPKQQRKKTSKKIVQTIVNNEIQRTVWKDTNTGEVKDNKKEVEKYAKYYFDGELRSKLVGQPATLTYAGFLNIFPDGRIFQVSWLMGDDGAKTRVSLLKEDTRDVISYREMQWIQNTNRIVAEADAKKKEQPRK